MGRSPELAGLMGGMKNQRDENADLGQRLSRRWSGSHGSRPLSVPVGHTGRMLNEDKTDGDTATS